MEAARKAVKPTDNGSAHPTDDEYKQWCEKEMNEEITADGLYQDKYLIIKSVCSNYGN